MASHVGVNARKLQLTKIVQNLNIAVEHWLLKNRIKCHVNGSSDQFNSSEHGSVFLGVGRDGIFFYKQSKRKT